MALDLEKTGNLINVVQGDSDSTTTSRLQAEFYYNEKQEANRL